MRKVKHNTYLIQYTNEIAKNNEKSPWVCFDTQTEGFLVRLFLLLLTCLQEEWDLGLLPDRDLRGEAVYN